MQSYDSCYYTVLVLTAILSFDELRAETFASARVDVSAFYFIHAAPRRLASESLMTKRALSRATSLASPAAFTESKTASKSL